jgi:polyisoprenoid-binding protein YceI
MLKIISLLGLFAFCCQSWAAKFEMKDLGQRNLVLVNSEALVERTVAVSHFVTGWIELSPENVETLAGEFELDVRTLETGLELKNMQIRDQLLSSSEFPVAKISFSTPVSGQKPKLTDGKPWNSKIDANLQIKNVTKTIPIQIKLVYFKENEESRQRLTGNLLKFSAQVEIELSSFGIVIPSKYSAVIAKTVQVSADLVGTDRLPNNALSLPEGIKKK